MAEIDFVRQKLKKLDMLEAEPQGYAGKLYRKPHSSRIKKLTFHFPRKKTVPKKETSDPASKSHTGNLIQNEILQPGHLQVFINKIHTFYSKPKLKYKAR